MTVPFPPFQVLEFILQRSDATVDGLLEECGSMSRMGLPLDGTIFTRS